jgi:hypothetical protein
VCGFCDQAIPEGTPYRAGDLTPCVWCPTCAQKGLQETPPDDLSVPVPVTRGPLVLPWKVFNRGEVGARLRENIQHWRRDGKAQATGEQE